jgi:Na+-translocating ferredoxin:NAD+ oxidoreductase RnfC subunit
MILTEINKVTDKTEFNSYVDFETEPTADLKCLNCENIVSINFSNLKKHKLSDFTNLSEQDTEKMTDFIKEKLTEIPNSFLDYYCPNCGIPTKLLYEIWAGGKHGEYGFKLKNLISGIE